MATDNVIEFPSKMRESRLKSEVAQERGEIKTAGSPAIILNGNNKASIANIGVTAKQIHEAREVRDAEEAELCPVCEIAAEYLNVGRVHWCYCTNCGAKWRFGENLFSGWRDESPARWESNKRFLDGFSEVEAS